MTSKERVLKRERDRGRMAAQEVQERSTVRSAISRIL